MINVALDFADTFEIVRDKVAEILINEFSNQFSTISNESEVYNVAVYMERSHPWGQFEDNPTHETALINVWFDNDNMVEAGSNTVHSQKMTGTINIDCYACSAGEDTAQGHMPSDEGAGLKAHRLSAMVRKILQAAEYTYLGLPRNLLTYRRITTRTAFQPRIDDQQPAPGIKAVRLVLQVDYLELSPQIAGEIMDQINIDLIRGETGQLHTTLTFIGE